MKKVLLGMSGGVDSSVSALLLKNQGYEVYGVTMNLFENSGCCNNSAILDATKICNQLGIKHYTLDFRETFSKKVICNFVEAYNNCLTPNPCIECNKYLKFGVMYEKAIELGIDYIATGHYAKTEFDNNYDRYILKKSNNEKKDQSYVLYSIPKEIIKNIIFPLGDFIDKNDVRKIAMENNLATASKSDSEDICFIPKGNYKEFLEKNSYAKPKKGNIVTTNGEVLGQHNGLYYFTIGQRKGLGIAYKEPLFVIGFNRKNNEVIVGTKDQLYKKEILVGDINLLLVDDIKEPMEVSVKTRYSSSEAKAVITKNDENTIKVVFDEPQARITPGQSAVFYLNDIVVGGGKII